MSVASAVLTDMDTLLRHVLNVRQHGAGEGVQGSGDVQGRGMFLNRVYMQHYESQFYMFLLC